MKEDDLQQYNFKKRVRTFGSNHLKAYLILPKMYPSLLP